MKPESGAKAMLAHQRLFEGFKFQELKFLDGGLGGQGVEGSDTF